MPVDYPDALESYEASDWEADWPESDFSEAKKKGHAPAPQKYTPPPANQGYVANATFQTAMDKVRADVAANRTAITNVGSRVDELSKRTRSEVKSIRQQAARDRDDTRNTLQTLAILPLLTAGGSTTALAPGVDGKPTEVKVATPPSTTTEILPLLLLSGFGSSPSSGSGSAGGMDSGMLMAVALMAAGPR